MKDVLHVSSWHQYHYRESQIVFCWVRLLAYTVGCVFRETMGCNHVEGDIWEDKFAIWEVKVLFGMLRNDIDMRGDISKLISTCPLFVDELTLAYVLWRSPKENTYSLDCLFLFVFFLLPGFNSRVKSLNI